MENTLRCNWTSTLALWTEGCNLIGDWVHGVTTHEHLCPTAGNLLSKGEMEQAVPKGFWPADQMMSSRPLRPILARTWAQVFVKIFSRRVTCHTVIYWQAWIPRTMVVSPAGAFIGHSLNLVPTIDFYKEFWCPWSWLRVTGTCEFACDPLSHSQLLCLYMESSSQHISNNTKREAALRNNHGFKGNWWPGHIICYGLLADMMHMHPADCSLIAWALYLEN